MVIEPRRKHVIAVLALVLLSTMGKVVAQERKVQGRVENSAFGFAVTIPPERTATLVQNSSIGSPTLFITVALPKPVGLDLLAEFSSDRNRDPDADIRAHIKSLSKLGVKDITRDEGQAVMLGDLPARKYRVHCTDSEGASNSEVWVVARRALRDESKRSITYTITLGGPSADVEASEADLDSLVRSFEVIGIVAAPPNNAMQRTRRKRHSHHQPSQRAADARR